MGKFWPSDLVKVNTKNNASLIFVVITIMLDAIGLGLVIPILPDVIRRFGTDPSFVNHYFGYFISVYALMQFLASPVLGALSDKYGRRSVLLVSLLGAGLDYILMAFAPNLSVLFIGRIISGLTGASMTVASSYIADISDDSNRAANFGMIGASFGIGFIVGPALGGMLASYGHAFTFLVAAALTLLNFFFGLFILPESLPKEMRREVSLSRLNPFKSIHKVLFQSKIMILVWINLFLNLAGQSHPSIWTLYTRYKFGWSALEVGLSLTAVGVAIGFSQGYMVRILVPKFGERKSVSLGILFMGIGFMVYGLATQGWMVYAAIAFFAFTGITIPALQTLISKNTPSSEQGELQGSMVAIASLTAIIGPLLYTELFTAFTAPTAPVIFAGAPYMAATFFCVICMGLMRLVKK